MVCYNSPGVQERASGTGERVYRSLKGDFGCRLCYDKRPYDGRKYHKSGNVFGVYATDRGRTHISCDGNLLYQACLEGFHTKGVLGMFTNLLTTTSAGISASVIFAFLVTVFLSPKD